MAHLKYSVLFLFLLTSAILIGHHTTNGLLEPALLKSLATLDKSDVLVHFSGQNSPVIKNIQRRTFRNKLAKVEALCSDLRELADVTQGPVSNFVKEFGVQGRSFWSSNQMVIRNATLSLLQGVDAFPQVSRIQKLPIVPLSPVVSSGKTNAAGQTETIQWGVEKIQADQVWSTFDTRGEGVVVASIDTGVRGTHEALKDNWRSDHGWFDPYINTTTPNDYDGRGTHAMGTICGQDGFGVAPGAKWISCRGCGNSTCDAEQLLACGQWMLSPSNPNGSDPDPSLIPHVVCNPWSSRLDHHDWYNATIAAWGAARILHVFAVHDSRRAYESEATPANQNSTLSVGSTDKNDRLSSFSSKGPDIVAPGSDIFSASNTGDSAYSTLSGTGMATSHVAGTIALMIAANRKETAAGVLNPASLSQKDVVNLIEKTADTLNLTVPNDQFGYGRINALKAVTATVNGLPPTASNTH